jgi:ArsR family transcriptional regulator, arsenate/arsenite/antimonite-responsive transcriptional repressor / arsenate reductase (thioredoxin)
MTDTPPALIQLLSHDLRWQIVKSLTQSDYRVNELVDRVEQPLNLVSYHLKKLRDEALVTTRRSEADGRDTYYSLDLDHLQALYQAAGAALHPSLVSDIPSVRPRIPAKKILFVCTHNSARSQMAEGLMRHLSDGQIDVISAGSEPTMIHPDAIATMETLGIDIQTQTSKHFDTYLGQPFDYVISVCDRAREVCPIVPTTGQQIHWGFPDPAAIKDAAIRQQAFMSTANRLKSRIEHFLSGLQKGTSA